MTIETALEQASMTASDYFHRAIETIDEKFGEGYAKDNPVLIGAFMQVSASDFHTMWTAENLRNVSGDLAGDFTIRK